MEQSTKERILDTALEAFAANGYKGTNLRDLAAGMGLSKSALYKHYAGKEDIWNAVLDRMEAYYSARFGSPEQLPETPKSCEELIAMTMGMLDFTMSDPKVVLTRKILLTEQFHDERVRQLATLHFLTGTRDMFAKIFADMMDAGLLKRSDPEMLAFAYTAPVTALVHLSDREPDRAAEIREQIESFLRVFLSTCAAPEKEG